MSSSRRISALRVVSSVGIAVLLASSVAFAASPPPAPIPVASPVPEPVTSAPPVSAGPAPAPTAAPPPTPEPSVIPGTALVTTTIPILPPPSQPTALPPVSASTTTTGADPAGGSTTSTLPGAIPVDGLTTTTLDPLLTTTSFDPNSTTTSSGPSTSTTLPIAVDVGDDDAISEEAPNIPTPVLPAPRVPARNQSLEDALRQLSEKQQALIRISQKRADVATQRIADSTHAIKDLRDRENEMSSKIGELEGRMAGTRTRLRSRALAIFAGEEAEAVSSLIESENANQLARNVEYLSQAQKRDRAVIEEFVQESNKIETARSKLALLVDERQSELEAVLAEQQALTDALQKMQQELASISTGAKIVLGGFVFPVTAPFNFVDTMGAPRMTGTKYEHRHQGTDIFGAYGSPVIAVTQGVVFKQGVTPLGGNRLWLKGSDGTEYYYAHLSAFVQGLADGTVVEAGDVIGFLGDSGNARGTPPHVHFEVHPGGLGPVNPYPFLKAVVANDASAFIRASREAAAAASVSTIAPERPGEIRAGIGIVREVALGTLESIASGPTTTQPPGAPATTLPVRPAPGATPAPAPAT